MARAVRLESFTHQYLVFRAYNLVRYDIKRIVLFSFVLFLCRFSLHRTSYQLLQLYYLYQQRFQITSTVKYRAWRKSKKSTLEESYVFYGFRVCGLMGHVRDLFITDWSLSSQTISELVTQSNVSSTLKFLDDQQESTSWAFVALTLAIYRVTQHAWSLEVKVNTWNNHLDRKSDKRSPTMRWNIKWLLKSSNRDTCWQLNEERTVRMATSNAKFNCQQFYHRGLSEFRFVKRF